MSWKPGLVLVALGCITACGGSSGSAPVAISTPTPTPTPAPTPTPTPTPLGIRYQAEGAGPLLAELHFYRGATIGFDSAPLNGSAIFSALATDRNGAFSVNTTTPLAPPHGIPFIDDGLNSIAAFGIDGVSGLRIMNLTAPIGSTVISPITSLIYAMGDQALVKRALQLDNLGFALSDPSRDLRTFSWVRTTALGSAGDVTDARRLRASNIRLFALLNAVEQFRAGPGYPFFLQTALVAQPEPLAAVIKAKPQIQLYTAEGVETVLRSLPRSNPGEYRDDVFAAAAHLITLYSVAIGPLMTDDDVAASYMLGTQGYLLRTLWELTSANTAEAASRVMALGISDIYQGVAPFAEHPVVSTNTLFPVPDFLFVPASSSSTVPFYDRSSNISPSLAGNDLTSFVGQNQSPLSLIGITVPARFATSISVTQQSDQSVVVQAKTGFTGVAWFDYAEQTPGGIKATGRAYVIVK